MQARRAYGRITFLSTTGLLGMLVVLWLAGVPPAHAQLSPNSQIEECVADRISRAQSEGRTVSEQLRQRIEELCRRELSQQDRRRSQDQRSTIVPGQFSEEQVQACLLEGIQIARAGDRNVTQQLRRRIEEICRRDGALPESTVTPGVQPEQQNRPASILGQQTPVAVSDERLRECIRRVLGSLPTDRRSVTDE